MDFLTEYRRELERLGLDERTCPYGASSTGSEEAAQAFLASMRALQPGATWRDVFPDIPAHWDLDDEDTWTAPYRPYGAFDYPHPPAGPVVMAAFRRDVPDEALVQLLADARVNGFAVYGAGFIEIANPDWPDRPVRIVLDRRTTLQGLHDFTGWLETRPDVECQGVSRQGDERYAS